MNTLADPGARRRYDLGVKIILANPRGFCAGVYMAIDVVDQLLEICPDETIVAAIATALANPPMSATVRVRVMMTSEVGRHD